MMNRKLGAGWKSFEGEIAEWMGWLFAPGWPNFVRWRIGTSISELRCKITISLLPSYLTNYDTELGILDYMPTSHARNRMRIFWLSGYFRGLMLHTCWWKSLVYFSISEAVGLFAPGWPDIVVGLQQFSTHIHIIMQTRTHTHIQTYLHANAHDTLHKQCTHANRRVHTHTQTRGERDGWRRGMKTARAVTSEVSRRGRTAFPAHPPIIKASRY